MSQMLKVPRNEATGENKDWMFLGDFDPSEVYRRQQGGRLCWLTCTNRSLVAIFQERCSCQTEMTAALAPLHRVSCLRANGARAKT